MRLCNNLDFLSLFFLPKGSQKREIKGCEFSTSEVFNPLYKTKQVNWKTHTSLSHDSFQTLWWMCVRLGMWIIHTVHGSNLLKLHSFCHGGFWFEHWGNACKINTAVLPILYNRLCGVCFSGLLSEGKSAARLWLCRWCLTTVSTVLSPWWGVSSSQARSRKGNFIYDTGFSSQTWFLYETSIMIDFEGLKSSLHT